MRFTWRALVLAPVFVPLLYCALLAVAVDDRPLPIGSFLVLFVPAAAFFPRRHDLPVPADAAAHEAPAGQ